MPLSRASTRGRYSRIEGITEIPQTDEEEEDTHSAATTEKMDEEIEVDADVSMHHEIIQTPPQESMGEENGE